MCCLHLLKGRLYSHSTVQTMLSQQNLQILQTHRCAHMYLCAANKYLCCQHHLKGRLYSHSMVKTTLSEQNFQHFKPTDVANKYLWLPASSEGKIVLTQYSLNNALPAELPTLQTNRCGQQEPMLSASTHTVRSKQRSFSRTSNTSNQPMRLTR